MSSRLCTTNLVGCCELGFFPIESVDTDPLEIQNASHQLRYSGTDEKDHCHKGQPKLVFYLNCAQRSIVVETMTDEASMKFIITNSKGMW